MFTYVICNKCEALSCHFTVFLSPALLLYHSIHSVGSVASLLWLFSFFFFFFNVGHLIMLQRHIDFYIESSISTPDPWYTAYNTIMFHVRFWLAELKTKLKLKCFEIIFNFPCSMFPIDGSYKKNNKNSYCNVCKKNNLTQSMKWWKIYKCVFFFFFLVS